MKRNRSSDVTSGSQVTLLVLTLDLRMSEMDHSVLEAPRLVFSVVGLNKTKTRNSLALDGTLSSIMTIKMADLEPCFKWEPPSDVLKASKKATGQYNRAHRS
ncbi:unnamed protein product [Boreogadus saida]